MKLKDMTENIKTRSAEPLNDDKLENVSGGFGLRLRKPVYIVWCTKCKLSKEFEDDEIHAVKYIKSLGGDCHIPDCGGKILCEVEQRYI